MTDLAPEAVVPDVATDQVDAPESDQGPNLEEELAHWKAMSRKNEEAAKANKKAAAELAELKKAQMTAEERAAAAAKETAEELERTRNENIRYKAAATYGISEEYFGLLGTGTEEEIIERAVLVGELEDAVTELAQLKAQFGMQQDAANTPGPVPQLRPGNQHIPDDSYPVGWFPGLAASKAREANSTER